MSAKISVLILAKNEEKFIGTCIKSVKSFADEIIVIDDNSTDQTSKIATSLGAKVVTHSLDGDWGRQQTFAVQQASYEWIFFIDSDERVTDKLSEHIKQILAEDDRRFAYLTARLSYFWGQPLKHGGWFPDYVVRLLPRKGTYVEGFVHQKICHDYVEKKLPQDEYLVHYPYRDWNHYFNKLNFYTTLAAKKMKEAGKSATLLDMILHPFWAAFRMYFLRSGWRDGLIGFILASFHYFYTMAKYVKLYYIDEESVHDENFACKSNKDGR